MQHHLSPNLTEQLATCEERLVVTRSRKSLTIGLPSENPKEETRISLTPQGVEVLTTKGHNVMVQRGAGLEARFSDESYAAAGATIVDNVQQIWSADLVVRVSPPTVAEAQMLKKGQTVMCMIGRHKREREVYTTLAEKQVTLLASDYVGTKASEHQTDAGGGEPALVSALGEIEGMMAMTTAANMLQHDNGGKGIIIGGITGVPPTEVIIIGSGTAAQGATRAAMALGCNVKVFDTDLTNLQRLTANLPQHVFTSVLHPQALTKALRSADAIVGTRHHNAYDAYCIPSDYLELLKKGAVIVDMDNDPYRPNDGRTEWTHVTSLSQPTYVYNSLHFHCLPDITATVPHTASIVMSDLLTPLIASVADEGGMAQAARFRPAVRQGIALWQGTTTNHKLAKMTRTEYYDIRLLLI